MKTETDTHRIARVFGGWIAGAMLVAGAAAVPAATNAEPVFANTNKAPALATNAPAAGVTTSPGGAPPARDYASFKLINDRNIFNPNRSRRSARGDADRSRAAVTESFSLVGTMSSSKGDVAFFDGSSSSYKKVLKPGDKIGGYKITGITPHVVQLEKEGDTVDLAVGAQMKRQDDGPWKMTASALALASESSPANETKPESGEADDDVVKRLLKKREEEMNK